MVPTPFRFSMSHELFETDEQRELAGLHDELLHPGAPPLSLEDPFLGQHGLISEEENMVLIKGTFT
ncbi:hypothetical protein [Viridibacterium curvum]|uniref:Uncharacterized protein n=1 Tax=Viridibacterium curvum TaxID=1101404 RepID=A0ABP9QJW9_9RHOO